MKEYLAFARHLLRPRAVLWCFRMSSFDRACWSVDFLKLRFARLRELHEPYGIRPYLK